MLQTFMGYVSFPFCVQKMFYIFAYTWPPSHHFSLFFFFLKSDAREFSFRCCRVPGLLSWKSKAVKQARKNCAPTKEKNNPLQTLLRKLEMRTPINNSKVNVSSHAFLGTGLSEIGERVRGYGFIFENRNLDSV